MITTSDIADIIYKDCAFFDMERVPDGATLTGALTEERLTIHVKRPETESYWRKGFVEVNLCVPDIGGQASGGRLRELERTAQGAFRDYAVGTFDGSRYRYSLYSSSRERDESLECHYINVRILFEVLNVKNN
jgi:hypothetical protein